jgi:hypothetical protein
VYGFDVRAAAAEQARTSPTYRPCATVCQLFAVRIVPAYEACARDCLLLRLSRTSNQLVLAGQASWGCTSQFAHGPGNLSTDSVCLSCPTQVEAMGAKFLHVDFGGQAFPITHTRSPPCKLQPVLCICLANLTGRGACRRRWLCRWRLRQGDVPRVVCSRRADAAEGVRGRGERVLPCRYTLCISMRWVCDRELLGVECHHHDGANSGPHCTVRFASFPNRLLFSLFLLRRPLMHSL